MGLNTAEQEIAILLKAHGVRDVKKQLTALNREGAKLKKTFEGAKGRKSKEIVAGMNKKTLNEDLVNLKTHYKKKEKLQKEHTDYSNKEAKRFKGEYLGLMFAGMALQRTFTNLFRGLITNYKEFTKESVTPLSESLIKLQANWKFLKFQMVEAATPLLMKFADWFSAISLAISKMDTGTLSTFVGSIIALAGVGGLMSVFGQGAIFFTSIYSASVQKDGLDAINKTLQGTGDLDTNKLNAGTSFFKSLKGAAGLGLIALGISETIQGLENIEQGEWVNSILNAVSAGLMSVAGVKLLKGGSWKTAGLLGGVALGFTLLESDTLMTNISRIMGAIDGMLWAIINAFQVGWAKLKVRMAGTWLGDALFGTPSTSEIQLASLELGKAMSIGFETGYKSSVKWGKQLDDKIAQWKAKADSDPMMSMGGGEMLLASTSQAEKYGLIDKSAKSINKEFGSIFGNIVSQNNELTKLFSKVKEIGGEWNVIDDTIAVSLPQSTYDFIIDDKQGMAALYNEVNKVKKEMDTAFPEKRTVEIEFKYTNIGQSVFSNTSTYP